MAEYIKQPIGATCSKEGVWHYQKIAEKVYREHGANTVKAMKVYHELMSEWTDKWVCKHCREYDGSKRGCQCWNDE